MPRMLSWCGSSLALLGPMTLVWHWTVPDQRIPSPPAFDTPRPLPEQALAEIAELRARRGTVLEGSSLAAGPVDDAAFAHSLAGHLGVDPLSDPAANDDPDAPLRLAARSLDRRADALEDASRTVEADALRELSARLRRECADAKAEE